MKIAIAKELYSSCVFRNALLTEQNGKGWILHLYRKTGDHDVLCNDKGETRVFKTIEAGLKAAEAIGFAVLDVSREKPKAPGF